MKRKFIIHIGPAKTGTSSLQEVLFEHRDTLLANGYDYPGFGRHAQMLLLPGHHGIPARLQQFHEVPPGVIENLAALPDNRTVIFSSENLAHIGAEGVRILIEALDPEDLEIVYYARRWDHLLPSVWQELVKHGNSRTFLEFLNTQVSAPMASIYLNYLKCLEPWAKVVGPRRLRIFSYDMMVAAGDDIVTHFCREVLGLKLDIAEERRENRRQTPENTEILRLLNKMAFAGRPPSPAVRFALTRKREELADDLAEIATGMKPYLQQVRPYPVFLYDHLERMFLKTFGNRVENLSEGGRLLKDHTIANTPYVSQDYLLEGGMIERFRALLDALGPL